MPIENVIKDMDILTLRKMSSRPWQDLFPIIQLSFKITGLNTSSEFTIQTQPYSFHSAT